MVGSAAATPLDFPSLRQQAITLVQRLAGGTWTDHNTHDPGITILEQLCYALTDLGYRSQFALPDLLTRQGHDPCADLPAPAQILPTRPVTISDLRKVVIDVPGVRNAWIELVDEAAATFNSAGAEVSALAPGTTQPAAAPNQNISEIRVEGLLRIRVEMGDVDQTVVRSEAARAVRSEVARRLHRHRPLGVDLHEIHVLEDEPIRLNATLEIGAVADATGLLASIYRSIAGYFSPTVPFRTVAEMLERGRRVDEIFEGPLLDHGSIDTEDLAGIERRSSVRISDLIRVLMAVPGVLAVKSLHFTDSDGKAVKDWLLTVAVDNTPRFDLQHSQIQLQRRGLQIDQAGIKGAAQVLYESLTRETVRRSQIAADERDVRPPPVRDRHVANYHSIQEDFPMTYGIGAAGLPQSAPPARRALAKQLKAYLMFYDQLLANQFAQLANVGKLFSFRDEMPNADDSYHSYFSQVIPDDGVLELDEIRVSDPDEHRALLQRITEEPADAAGSNRKPGLQRRNRFLDHLLARFGEEFHDYALLQGGEGASAGMTRAEQLARDKRAFLRDYPRIGRDRGTAFNLLERAGEDNCSGLELTLRRKLGITDDEKFYVVEHILLRPLAGDVHQSRPLFRRAQVRDPYSLQISLVFPGWLERYQDANFRQFVERTVLEETPAHLSARVLWKEKKKEMQAFELAYHAWLEQWRTYRLAELERGAMSPPDHAIPLRSARDRLIDLLGIGDTYPLTDLNVATHPPQVPYGGTASIEIENAQAGVSYQLCDPAGEALGDTFKSDGADITPDIETPAVRENVTYRVRVSKHSPAGSTPPAQSPHFLDNRAPVKVGIDTSLGISILAAQVLDGRLADPKPSDPRIVPYGSGVEVQVDKTQEQVQYSLIIDGREMNGSKPGNRRAVSLQTGPMTEDAEICVRATQTSPALEDPSKKSMLLDARVYLKVIANPVLAVSVDTEPILDYRQATAIKIADTQKSVEYRAYLRRISDVDFVHGDAGGADLVTVPVPGWPDVQVKKPPPAAPDTWRRWHTPAGFAPLGDAPVPGTGWPLRLPIPSLTDDSLIIIQALKHHLLDASNPASATITSTVQLNQAVALLVSPDRERVLTLRVPVIGAETGDRLQVADGQPGVFYHFRPSSGGDEFPLPAYFHQRDEHDTTQNKGVDQLGVEIDLTLAAEPEVPLAPGADLAKVFPRLPLLDITPLPVGTRLACRAVKAQTKVEVEMAQLALIAAVPSIRAEQTVIDYGGSAKIVIPGSQPEDQYQVTLAGVAVGLPLAGNNGELVFTSAPLSADATFEVVVSSDAAKGIRVERVVAVQVLVRPNAALRVSATADTVAVDMGTQIIVEKTQSGVVYQLLSGHAAVGSPLPGNGASIVLPTGPIAADTTFSVAAARADQPEIAVVLAAQATVTLKSGA